MASSVTFKTAEYKIDNQHSIKYVTPVYKVPFFGFELTSLEVPDVTTTLISDAPLDYLDPGKGKNKNKVYEYQGKYYLEFSAIESALLNDIYQHPESFLSSSRIFTDSTLNDGGYKISETLRKMNAAIVGGSKTDIDGKEVSKAKYEVQIEKEKTDYANYVFKRNFEPNIDLQFTDGFGEVFSTKREALDSFNLKLNDNPNIKFKYIFRKNDNEERFDTLEGVKKFARKNRIINSKEIRFSDLLNTTTFDQLENISSTLHYSVCCINYYGELRYFKTEEQA